MTRFLVIGGAHMDRRAYLDVETTMGASNPGHWHEEPGGGGFNAARNLSRFDNAVSQFSVRGGDAGGRAVEESAAEFGVDYRPLTYLDRATPSYSAVLERDGNLVIGVADMSLYDWFSPRQLSRRIFRDAIAEADCILCDANLPEATLIELARHCDGNGKMLAAIAISPAKVIRLEKILAQLSILFLNAAEARRLCGEHSAPEDWPRILHDKGLDSAVITNGADPVIAFHDSRIFEVHTVRLDKVTDVTGAGDALAAATLDRLARGSDLTDAVRHGIAAACITLRSGRAVAPEIGIDALAHALLDVESAIIRTETAEGNPL